ncbi:CcdB family protein [Comamonas flocculans]|uniref:Toxin CcdB n=1 Tax=Comamonas flocculans TaxID=2597701 RepID=A0A5B8RQG6_9BURK|nr:CcdB family protein [Comamonas flocculans]QEA11786.1 plasmid maintenance protein CcdB [Comamonas flocculans]
MPQFDVHLNPGPQRDTVPMVVLVQSALFDGYRRRVVVPLVRRSALPAGGRVVGTRMNPVFEIGGQTVVLHPLDMVSVAMDQLGPVVGNLAEQGQVISDALDELLTRSWG